MNRRIPAFVLNFFLFTVAFAGEKKEAVYTIVTDYGVSNSGSPVGPELNELVRNSFGGTLYFPAGTYNLTEPIVTPFDYDKNVNLVFDKNAHVTSAVHLEALVKIGFTEFEKISPAERDFRRFSYVEGGHFDAKNADRGIWVNGLKQMVTLKDLSLYNCKGRHIEISCTNHFRGTGSSDTKIMNVCIQGDSSNEDNYGIFIGPRCGDCKISDTFVYGTGTGMYTEGAGHIVNNFHILTWRVGEGKRGAYSNTVGIRIAHQGFYQFNEVYFDTTCRDFVIDGDIDVQLIADKCITHSWIPDFGSSFISWTGRASGKSALQAKVVNCIFNLDYKPQDFKIFDLPQELILDDNKDAITFHDNIIRSPGRLSPFDLSLLLRFRQKNTEILFDEPAVVDKDGVVIGAVAPSRSQNELMIVYGDGSSSYLLIDSNGTVAKNRSTSRKHRVRIVKAGQYNLLVLCSDGVTRLFPEVRDLSGSSTFLSTPSRSSRYRVGDYMRASGSMVDADAFDAEIDGVKVGLYTLKSSSLTMQVTNYGGRVVSLFVPDRDGRLVDVVLGHNSLDEYINYKKERFLGAVVGPYANRICNASYTFEGTLYTLSPNHNGKGTLHGGFKGLDSKAWDVISVTDSSIVLHCLHRDGEEGFPGNLDILMTYTLSGETWRIEYSAQTDKTRPVNITNHPYFNLSGEGNGSCLDYVLCVNADRFIGTDGLDVIESPIGVDGLAMDYREPHAVVDAIESGEAQIVNSNVGFDHNFCINGDGMRFGASLYNKVNGIFLEVYSDQPGIQLYSGQWWTGEEIGKCGRKAGKYSSFTFETQNYPDAPNKPSFPDPFVRPGQVYTHLCEYRFSVKENE